MDEGFYQTLFHSSLKTQSKLQKHLENKDDLIKDLDIKLYELDQKLSQMDMDNEEKGEIIQTLNNKIVVQRNFTKNLIAQNKDLIHQNEQL